MHLAGVVRRRLSGLGGLCPLACDREVRYHCRLSRLISAVTALQFSSRVLFANPPVHPCSTP
jgi:hypothetical protein